MRLSVLLVGLVAIGFAGCTYPPPDIIPEQPALCEVSGTPKNTDLLFITERMVTCDGGQLKVTNLRGSTIMYGAASWDKSLAVRFYPEQAWRAELQQRLKSSKKRPLLFIHGVRNSNDSALTTAFAVRLVAGPNNEVIALTWPSYDNLAEYWWDEANVDWAARDTEEVIAQLAGFDRGMTILAHSAGNRITLNALELLPRSVRKASVTRFIMASPDVDRAKAIAELPTLAIPVTVYGSTWDQVLTGSWRDHGLPRAGDLSTHISGHAVDYALSNSPKIDIVDTSRLHSRFHPNHSNFIETAEGAADLCRLVNDDENPGRGRLRDKAGPHWILLKETHPDPTDKCATRGTAAARWFNK